MSELASLVDGLAPERVVVFGSPPPEGRDLDVLVRPPARGALEAALAGAGFVARAPRWARLRDCTIDVVELHDPHAWGIGPAEAEDLFARATPLPGAQRLAAPAPHHALLILARRLGGRGPLSARHRQRVAAVEADQWTLAARSAPAWGVPARLEWLARARHGAVPAGVRARALEERLRALGPAGAAAAAARRARPRRGLVVALSGLDGSGKSTHCEALRDVLDRLGVPAEVRWTSIVAHPWLYPASERVKPVLARLLRRPYTAAPSTDEPRRAVSSDPLGVAFRARGGAVTFAWTALLVLANAQWHRRVTRPARRGGRAVVCDRYTLDSRVQLRYAYGEDRRFGPQSWILRHVSPAPDLAFYLAVRAETALERNREYAPEEVARRARLYEEEHAALGYRRVDAERPAEEVCAQLGRAVLDALP